MAETTNLRQATNQIECRGILAETDVQQDVNPTNGKQRLNGTITIKIDELNSIRFNVRADATKKDSNDPNPAYDNIKKFLENSTPISVGGEQSATRVYTKSGKLNPYHSSANNQDYLNYSLSFIGEDKGDAENFEPIAEASVELYVQSIVDEFDKEGQPTGRAIVKGWMPTYNGIEPLSLIAPADIADDVRDAYEVGCTACFFVDIVNNRVTKTTEIPTRIGKPRTKVEYFYTNELIITGASEPYEEGITEEAPYDGDAIRKAIQERADKIKAAEAKAKSSSTAPSQARPSGESRGRTANW